MSATLIDIRNGKAGQKPAPVQLELNFEDHQDQNIPPADPCTLCPHRELCSDDCAWLYDDPQTPFYKFNNLREAINWIRISGRY